MRRKFYLNLLPTIALTCLLATWSLAQSRVVSGTVKDSQGNALPGVTIQVKGGTSGTVSDSEGKYSLSVGENATLVISFIGFATQEIPVQGQSVIDVSLKEDTTQLQEVVVTALGIEKDKKSLSYAFQEVSGDKLTDTRDANMINALQGKVAGIQINRSASGIGGSSRVVLRGPKSTRENGVLYVIDGIPMANYSPTQPGDFWGQSEGNGPGRDSGDGISNINPSDIESINVLKGASAAALYGSSAANGVILINTKKGKAGQTKIDFSSDLTTDSPLIRPQLQFKYGQTTAPTSTTPGSATSWGSVVNGSDYTKNFFQTGSTWINSISMSGGTDKAQAYLSYSNTDNKGIIPTSTLKRHTVNFRETAKFLDDRLTLDASVNYITQKSHNRPVAGGMYFNPLIGLDLMPRGLDFNNYKNNYQYFSANRNMYLQNWWNNNYDKGLATTPSSWAGDGNEQNPYWLLNKNLRDDQLDRFFGAITLKYKISNWLSVQGRGRYDKSWNSYTFQSYAGSQLTLTPMNGKYTWEKIENSQIYGDALLLFNKQLNDFSLSGTIGGNITDYVNSGLIMDTNLSDINVGLLIPNVFTVTNIAPANESATQTYTHKQVQSVLGNATLGWKEKLFLDISGRNDWSSAFANTPTLKRGYFYYSAGLSGVISELVKLPEAISYAKARISYAKVGNDLPATATNPRNFDINATRSGTVVAGAFPYPGSYLKPEDNRSFEIGTELKFLNNRIGLDFTYYQNDNYNQYVTFPAPSGSSYSTYYKNLGHIQNKGVEISLNIVPVKNEIITWSSTFNFQRNKNTIVKLGDAQVSATQGYQLTGSSNGIYMSRIVEGGSWGDLYSNNVFKRASNGSILVNSDGTPLSLTPASGGGIQRIGSVLPTFQLGWYNSIDVKRFNISVLVDGRFGGKCMSYTQAYLDFNGVSKVTADARDKGTINIKATNAADNSAFTYSTPGQIANYYQFIGGQNGIAEAYVYSATNVRLRELSIGYNVPVKTKGIRSLRVSLVGRNLFFFYKDAPFDPDLAMSTGNALQGVDVFGLPSLRSIGGSIKLGF
ncbi:MAG: SusC/RagA family TonB-linked outer membrane protein [Cyclobacteriaceae bacterium]